MATSFLGIPPELRNMIYEYAIDWPTHQSWIDLRVAATPPSPLLLLHNRQIYLEAHKLLRRARYAYWSTNHFYLDIAAFENCDLALLRSKRLEHIRRLDLVFQEDPFPTVPRLHIYRRRLLNIRGI
ncbi:hypothetical protein CLAFUW4_13083 [Fulvia fulva]|uniref:Uncharacterized protein n=1 Tax=Passalora fulva TaxID=5499 RepID=A0A9Q8PJS9_PASFU|nr:uncharacterized protein CLAFUR5_12941 [Fulvia fulva]KAK4612188.1 hypothetical protein CLAFUR4_13087 [Fulvia fulva]KAK4613038.1 hypothetical protein CLAFUR0_13091 [Fulvia fulva]UJO23722.1 hypothetical protein CLAFUR5_12941 [Fulvia fulva]WPV21232.1 hypothetical protein CLAFUW4_13083 [Fulvia fulva]WPV36092.1 hypothetical protein CLAFUW7_13090 [Fulvia fulva]